MDLLQVSDICRQGEKKLVLSNISFSLHAFEKMVIAGETGSGKSSLLKIIAGLVQPDSGQVLFAGKKVTGPDFNLVPGHEGIAYLPQDFELRSNYRMEELLHYANTLPQKQAAGIYEVCRIDQLLKRRNNRLSGGEKQRIAIARLLVSAPQLLLLDEPYSNLDMIHKNLLKAVIHDISGILGITCIMVSHDPADILPWADRILVLQQGRAVQIGTPQNVYYQPATDYVAGLFGKYNLLTETQAATFPEFANLRFKGRRLLIRPEQINIQPGTGGSKGRISNIYFNGAYYEIETVFADCTLLLRTSQATFFQNDCIHISFANGISWLL